MIHPRRDSGPLRIAAQALLALLVLQLLSGSAQAIEYGTPSGASWRTSGNQASDRLGVAVASAGDVNGDGFDDVLIGSDLFENGQENEGRVQLFMGSPQGLLPQPAWSFESDQASALLGSAVAGAGDVNDDGFDDILVGAFRYDQTEEDEGRVFLFLGSATGLPATPDWTMDGGQFHAFFGFSLASAGDVNDDGHDDIIIGAWRHDNGEVDEGRAYVFLGNNSNAGMALSPVWTGEADQADAFFGRSVAGAGDVNNDGFADIVVGATGYDGGQIDEGRAYLYLGSAGGPELNPVWTTGSGQAGAQLGFAVSGAGSLEGDPYDDILVSAKLFNGAYPGGGAVFVFHGSSTGVETIASRTLEGTGNNQEFGSDVDGGFDFDGDGFPDVVVGARNYTQGQTGEGAAFVFTGSTLGLATVPLAVFQGEQIGGELGTAVARAGLVGGDAREGILTGAPRADVNNTLDAGAAFLFPGRSSVAGSALMFDGSGDVVTLPATGDLQLTQSDFTVEGWIHSTDYTLPQTVLSGGGNVASYRLGVSGGLAVAEVIDGSDISMAVTSPVPLTNGQWYHLAMVRNETMLELYVDGQSAGTNENLLLAKSGTVPRVLMGVDAGGCCALDGSLDDVRVWEVARSAGSILMGRSGPLTGSEPGLVAYWNLDEGSGQMASDLTGRGNDGTLGNTTSVDSTDPDWTLSGGPFGMDRDGDGMAWPADCNDSEARTHAGAVELCDGRDNDCNGAVDDDPSCMTACPSPSRAIADVNLTNATPYDHYYFSFRLARSGETFGVSSGEGWSDLLVFQAFTADGGLISSPVQISFGGASGSSNRELISGGSDFAATLSADNSIGFSPIFTRFSPSGSHVGPAQSLTDVREGGLGDYSMAWTGQGYGAFWTDFGLRFAPVSPGGERLAADRVVMPPGTGSATLAWTGAHFASLWSKRDGGGINQLFMHLFDLDGNPIGQEIQLTSGSEPSYGPRAVWTGSELAIFFRTSPTTGAAEIKLLRASSTGSPIADPVTVTSTTDGWNTAMAWTGNEFGLSYLTAGGLVFSRVSSDGVMFEPSLLLADGIEPQLLWTGAGFAVAWGAGPIDRHDIFFTRLACGTCVDMDGDGFDSCTECDDTDADRFPGNPEVCDNKDNDCDGVVDGFPTACGVGQCGALGVCSAGADSCLPGIPTPEVCDGTDNDCNGFPDDADMDNDTFTVCPDCDDDNPAINPAAGETCNGLDDDCNNLVDEDALGEDTDSDRVHNICDNCVTAVNPDQHDLDSDLQGDACDLDDGYLLTEVRNATQVDWQIDAAFVLYNSYRGDMSVLKSNSIYTQDEAAVPLATTLCGQGDTTWQDSATLLQPGDVVFYLNSGEDGAGIEGGLGETSAGLARPNDNPCP